MAEADILIAWNHGAIPASVKPAFTRPTRFINLPNEKFTVSQYGPSPIRGILNKYAPGVTPLRIGLLGFSASCSGVGNVLASSDGGFIDSVYACDGIHVGYTDSSKPGGVLKVEGLKHWLNFGALAANNARLFVISHSSVVPSITDEKGTRYYASTTETANYIWKTLTSNDDANAAVPAMPTLNVPPTQVSSAVNGPQRTVQYPAPPWKSLRRDDGLIIYGCSNLDKYAGTTDHVYQAKAIMPAVLAQVFAARWNAIDPKAQGQSCYIGGWPSHPADVFTLGVGACAESVVLPASYMTSSAASPLPETVVVAPAPAQSSSASTSAKSGIGLGALALGALAVGGVWWLARSGALRSNPTPTANPLPPSKSVSFDGPVAVIRYPSADDSKRVLELRVSQQGFWELRNHEGFKVSEGTVQYGQLGYARGPALPQTVDKAERVMRETGIWAYSGPNERVWGTNQP